MKLHLHYHDSNARHTRATVFIDGVSCGEVCLLTKDVLPFQLILSNGVNASLDEFWTSGRVFDVERIERKPND